METLPPVSWHTPNTVAATAVHIGSAGGDDRLGAEPVELEAETEIHRNDTDLNYVLSL